MKSNLSVFVERWLAASEAGVWSFLFLALFILFLYVVQLGVLEKSAHKYAFVSKNETRYLWYMSLCLTLAITFASCFWITNITSVTLNSHLYGIGFISMIIGISVGYSLYAVINFYYPYVLEKRLTHMRFRPRLSPKNGHQLRLLTEVEEDEYLTQEMIADENAHIYDYDVWIDEDTGEKIIEKYDAHSHALICENCQFRTLHDYKEEVIHEATDSDPGMVKRYYKCSYCNHKEEKIATTAPLSLEAESEDFMSELY
ncbi:MAG: hypothetical protein O2887_11115 [Bacteroidetes bacterium]|nr:hypothetical protein [Bacteroidota bacterium]